MIVLSAGMPKAGSGWYYNITNDLLVAAGHDDARAVRDRYGLKATLTAANCNLHHLRRHTLVRLDRLSREGQHTFVVKTHRRPTPTIRRLMAEGRFKVTYIFRDLRDVIVSGIDSGRVMRATERVPRHFLIGPKRSFAKLYSVREGLLWARWRLIPVWKAYDQCDGVLITRYEDLMQDTLGQVQRLADYLNLDVSVEQMESIIERYTPERIKHQPPVGLHFNKAVAGRYREALSQEEQELCLKRLGPYLKSMGYVD